MITHIGPEPGGEPEGIIRVELSLPLSPDEMRSLQDWLSDGGWSIELDQLDAYYLGQDWRA